MRDSILDLLVALLPFALSLVGVWTFGPLNRHKSLWRFGLVAVGVVFSVLIFVQQNRQRANAASDTRELKEQISRQVQESSERAEDLKRRFDVFVAETLRQKQSPDLLLGKCPDAKELAAEIDKRLSAHLLTNPLSALPDKPPIVTGPVPHPVPLASNPPVVPACQGDRLNECGDEQLLEWGKPLVANIQHIHIEYMANLKKLDDIKGGKMDWLREVTGIGGDKDSKYIKGFELASQNATQSFRDCCAERALAYHAVLLQRDSKRPDEKTLYDWVQDLLKPVNSKDSTKAREQGDNVGRVYFDLDFFQIDLDYIVSVQRNKH